MIRRLFTGEVGIVVENLSSVKLSLRVLFCLKSKDRDPDGFLTLTAKLRRSYGCRSGQAVCSPRVLPSMPPETENGQPRERLAV